MTYLLQVSTCWIVFYGIYLFFLRKETFFSINRYYLLGALATGLLVPYLGAFIPANETSVEVYQVMTQFTTIEVSSQQFVEEAAPVITWINLLWIAYILGGLIVFSRFIYGLNRIYDIYKEADKTPQANYTLVESDKYHLPFSFFHFIFISKQLSLNEEEEKVLKHEELHANQWHSIDIVFTELLQVFFWFNPILIFYKNALRQSHEYLADAYVTQNHNKNSYGQLLLQQSTSGLEIALANQFFHSQIKKRITMMYKEKSKRSAKVKYLMAVPVFLVMLIIFSSNQVGEEYSKDDLRKAFGETYSEITSLDDDDVIARLAHWDNFLNKHINDENFDVVSKDLESISEEYGIVLNVEEKEIGQPYGFGIFIHVISPEELKQLMDKDGEGSLLSRIKYDIIVDADGTFIFNKSDYPTHDVFEFFSALSEDRKAASVKVHYKAPSSSVAAILNCASKSDVKVNVETINNVDLALREDLVKHAETLFGIKDMLKYQYRTEDWDQITVLSNGAYMQDHIPLTGMEVKKIIQKIKGSGSILKVRIIKGTEWNRVDHLMSLAAAQGVKTEIIPAAVPTNFAGRKITTRNWHTLWVKYKNIKGKIVITAEANANGDIVYVEVVNDKTTIANKVILKDALKAAKDFKIERGSKSALGEIIFNLGGAKPHQGHIFDTDVGEFKFDSAISLGEQVPEGSVEVRIKDKLLEEDKDYTIDYTSGKLVLGESYNGETPVNVTFKENQGDPIFKVVEEMPRFPGCEDMEGTKAEKENCAKQKMLEFVYSNLKYPAKARDASVEGMCVVQFVVEKDGSVKEAKIVRDIGADCGAETMKVVNSFPIWIPGKQKGKAVRVQYTLPVKFKLEGTAKTAKKEVAKIVAMGKADKKAKKENLIIGEKTKLKEDIFKVVQEMPRFSGCEDMEGTAKEKEKCAQAKMLEYIYTNIKYPKEARKNGIDGMSVIRMVIERDGSVTNVSTLRDPGAGTGAEAARIVREMPIWVPGKQNGKAVRVQYTLPVKFKLEGDSNEKGESDTDSQIKTNLVYSSFDFKKIKDVNRILQDAGLKKNEIEKIIRLTLVSDVNIIPGTNFRVEEKKDRKLNNFESDLMSEASNGDRYFLEKIISKKDDKEIDLGTISIMIKDDILKGKTTGVDITKGTDSNIILKSSNYDGPQPLFVIDGEIKPEASMEKIDADDIEAINILKGEKAIDKYGKKGENGVVEITMKVKNNPTQYLIDGKLFGYEFYKTIDKSHINKEGLATKEDKFMRAIDGELIKVNMLSGYGFNSAYFPETNTVDGSDEALLTFVGNNIKYPKAAMDNNIEGLVTVRYTVEADGSLTNFKIGKSLGWGLDKAVIDMMEKLADEKGLWKAAYLDRRPVASSMVLPVKFKLQSKQKREAKSRKLIPSKFNVSPNPSNGKINVEYKLDRNIPASLMFYSSEGKTLKKMLNLPAENKVTVDLSSQNTSVIYISLEQDGKVKTIKATVQK